MEVNILPAIELENGFFKLFNKIIAIEEHKEEHKDDHSPNQYKGLTITEITQIKKQQQEEEAQKKKVQEMNTGKNSPLGAYLSVIN